MRKLTSLEFLDGGGWLELDDGIKRQNGRREDEERAAERGQLNKGHGGQIETFIKLGSQRLDI